MANLSRRGPWWGRLAAVMTVLALWVPMAGEAQEIGVTQTPILTIESDRFFSGSAFGRRVAKDFEAAGAELAAENRRIEAELTAEEQDLAEQRATMEPEAFGVLANAFDAKVQGIRRRQDAKARALADKADQDRVLFLRAAQPVLGQVMRESGASVILERASVFFSSNSSDITDLAISRIDAAIGDGTTGGADQP